MIDENKPMRDDDDNLEKIINRQSKKLQELNNATTLIKGKQDIKNELRSICEDVLQLSCSIAETKEKLRKIKEQNVRSTELLKLVETLDKRILHQEKNVPPELIQGYQNATISSDNILDSTASSINQLTIQVPSTTRNIKKGYESVEKGETIKNCKRTLFKEPEICPTIPFITAEEFNKVPKYIIGRQTSNILETINNFINAINQTLIAKYTILSMGKAALQKKGDINLYLHYKKQELDFKENEYSYFFTAEDFYRQTKTKMDKTKLNMITALRHCKRLRECRVKNDLRYVITSH